MFVPAPDTAPFTHRFPYDARRSGCWLPQHASAIVNQSPLTRSAIRAGLLSQEPFWRGSAFLEDPHHGGLAVFAKYVVHPERSGKNGVATQPFNSEEAPDEAPS
jgi:hypothetical protein